ncbi:RelA/SpoT family protein [[Clostridium] colinum]|uniref:RelA/SpoT family protein n=1 Tax=[Clostridium] colinum TaxID=36835 RepID=UPI0020256BAB|nr:bifunctional (p)ppGpp synthetase/guanosine-3',5'-bis(diphosphate) 3'-pyrophosphohydrolase [[Clostridium] colinum]
MEECKMLYDELIQKVKKYHPATDFSIIEKAYNLAKEAHGNQLRKSGEPYIIHPLYVAIILAELELDLESIAAGILHDVIEDTKYSFEDLKQLFNEEIAIIVSGVTKLDKFTYSSSSKEELQAENYRKMFLAMAKDIRVILIKVADRLHNMRTLQFMSREKQIEKAQETLDIYAPLATRLGIFKIKVELEDLCLRYLDPTAYYDLAEKIERKKHQREEYVEKIVGEISKKCQEDNIKCEIYGRPKHFFSIYKKMLNKNKTLDQIFDLFAVRIIVDNIRDCYEVLGIVHEMYKPIPSRFKDYIAMPKANMYQSLHNTLIGPEGLPFEIQIRTWEMHRIAEYGIAAHWKYKSGSKNVKESAQEEKLTWLRQILEWQKDMSDNKEFMETIKTDLDSFNENVYCFTPSGDVKSLPYGSIPIDFAYSIHSAVGNTMVGARVNGKIVTFDYILQNGDRIEIITSQNSRGPSMDWLKMVKSSEAKNKINQWFKTINKEENILKGKEMLEKEAKRKGFVFTELATCARIKKVLERYGFKDWDAICAAIGHGGLKEGQIINRFIEELKKEINKNRTAEEIVKQTEEIILNSNMSSEFVRKHKNDSGIVIQGITGLDIRVSKCCSPVPGDEIVGFVTKGRGVSIHRTDCINIINLLEDDRKRLIEANWSLDKSKGKEFLAEIRITGEDRLGLLVDITKVFTDEKLSLKNINARTIKFDFIIDATITIRDKSELEYICKKIKNIKGVYDIQRVTT